MKLGSQFNTCDLSLSSGVNEPIRLPVAVSRACSMNPLNWSTVPTRSTVYMCVCVSMVTKVLEMTDERLVKRLYSQLNSIGRPIQLVYSPMTVDISSMNLHQSLKWYAPLYPLVQGDKGPLKGFDIVL